jgi:hypothetical protein
MTLLPAGGLNSAICSSNDQRQYNRSNDSHKNRQQQQRQQQNDVFFSQCHQLQASIMMNDCMPSEYPKVSLLTFSNKNHKRVSFAPSKQNLVIEIPSYKDFTDEEYMAVYMSKEEMGKIHEECWRLVDLMNSGIEYEDQPGFSKRGLVDLKNDNVERRRRMRDQAYRIVFGIQKFQKDSRRRTECMDITEVTANLYSKAAARSQEEAYESAWFDSIAARS